MVHDRRIDGKTHIFGNQGALFMRAMTWWDHETRSIWSQPWGTAIDGPLKGKRLELIPASVMPWATWLADHPGTLVLKFREDGYQLVRESFSPDYVIGVAVGAHAKAYRYAPASEAGVINDRLGPLPVAVVVDAKTRAVHVYEGRAGDQELELSLRGGLLMDRRTGSTWDAARGTAVDGPLRGESLKSLPYITAYLWAWENFYPHTQLYPGDG